MIAATRSTIKRLRIAMIDNAIKASIQNQARARWMTLYGIKLSMIEQEHQQKLAARRDALMGDRHEPA